MNKENEINENLNQEENSWKETKLNLSDEEMQELLNSLMEDNNKDTWEDNTEYNLNTRPIREIVRWVEDLPPYEKRIHSLQYLNNNKKLKYLFKEIWKEVLWVHFAFKFEFETQLKNLVEEINLDIINEELEEDNKIIWNITVKCRYKREWFFWPKKIFSLSVSWKIRWAWEVFRAETQVNNYTYDYMAIIVNEEIEKIVKEFK